MLTPEQFAAKQAKERAAFERQSAIAQKFADAGLPIPSYIADSRTHGAWYVSYSNCDRANPRPMADAIDLFAQFPTIVPAAVLTHSSTVIHPQSRLPAKMAESYERRMGTGSDYAAWLAVSGSSERPGTRARLEFFADLGAELFSVHIEFGRGYIGDCRELRPETKETRGYGNLLQSRAFVPRPEVNAARDAWFGYGYESSPIKTEFDHRYLFVSDYGDECGPAIECGAHAIEMLRQLAEQTGA